MSQPNLSTEELADRWSVTTRTIKRWRSEGIGPRSFKVGQVVRYRLDDVEHFECRAPSAAPQAAGEAA
ncbi:putative terminase small subunit [Lysobacter antibioticus]|uniref:helix-turn-helix transcriptional regulator n=1 Tax=Lysobacter antibioticus TaxID=84531 RepID=UPI000717199F|nr:helix-turn-helix domain-containing protein [Lysobacter antibioticus]ALN64609.1 putative terminase small subunit [Lysobacter antibioticus]